MSTLKIDPRVQMSGRRNNAEVEIIVGLQPNFHDDRLGEALRNFS
jgi:hypothetical protein